MPEPRDDEKKFFDAMASRYKSHAILVPEASNFRNMVLDKAMRRSLTPILESFNKMLILDVGCGVGRWARIISNNNSVVGVDVSRFMIRMAKEACNRESCSFLVADASLLPFKENIFDLVISVTVLQHILRAEKFVNVLSEIARCSKSEVLVAEEMWSDRETLFENVYCPIRILPVESYAKSLSISGLQAYCIGGISPAPLAILLTRLVGSRRGFLESPTSSKLKASKTISKVMHFALGIGVLSAVFLPARHYDSRLSLHTVIFTKKKNAN